MDMSKRQWYRWPVAQTATAQAALDLHNNDSRLPLVGNNAKTGKPEPDNQKTVVWYPELMVFVDDMVGFPRMSDELQEAIGVTPQEREDFLAAFNPSIEDYDSGWFPKEE
jgi:hypothetical protein